MKSIMYEVVNVVSMFLAVTLKFAEPLVAPCRRLVWLSALRSRIQGTIPVTTRFDGRVHAVAGSCVTLGPYSRLGRGAFFETQEGGRIEVGSHVRINTGTMIVSYSEVRIGDDCLIGEYVSIRDADHGTDTGTPMRLQPSSTAAISIGKDVWIARGVVILKGVTIGDGAIIAANSVVTGDVPAFSVAAGAPARVVKERDRNGPKTV